MDETVRTELTRLEESQSFTDRTVEDLSKQIIDLYEKMEQLSGRVVVLERTIVEMREEPSGPDPDQPAP